MSVFIHGVVDLKEEATALSTILDFSSNVVSNNKSTSVVLVDDNEIPIGMTDPITKKGGDKDSTAPVSSNDSVPVMAPTGAKKTRSEPDSTLNATTFVKSFDEPTSGALVSEAIGATVIRPNASSTDPSQSSVNNVSQSSGFRVLCTTTDMLSHWGSFIIRCQDFKTFVEAGYPNVRIDALPYSRITNGTRYDATIVIKTNWVPISKEVNGITTVWNARENYGKIFVDVIDAYGLKDKKIPSDWGVIVQNRFQAENYKNHETFIVPHWFNSFYADFNDEPIEGPPEIRQDPSPLKVASVWSRTSKRDTYFSTEAVKNVRYDHIEQGYSIEKWFTKYVKAEVDVNKILKDPQLGEGYLYRKLFHHYDLLVIYPKGGTEKRAYNSIQRITSQMRSGAPVLLGCYGPAHQDFCETEQYPCWFDETQESFTQAMERMKDPSVRQECQERGLQISSKYSPRKIVKDYLRVLGADV
jgi:hypothetical protein